jgi:hypothetical protein
MESTSNKRCKLIINNIQVREFNTFHLAVKAHTLYPSNSGFILDSEPEGKET